MWLTPELFNLCLVFLGAFFWLYKERAESPPLLLRGVTSDLIAAAIWGAVTYSKPNNLFLIVPFLALIAWRRQWLRGLKVGLTYGLVLGGLFMANLLITGDMNYQGGERKTFSGTYPYQLPHLNFDNTGLDMRTDVIYTHQPWDIVAHDVVFFYFGRFSGIAIYFFPAAAAMLLFLFSKDKKLYQWLVLGIATFGGMLLVVWSPTNYFGGAGTLGNRYFTNLFPLYFFLVAGITRPIVPILAAWGAAAVFVASILIGPYQAGRRPGEHATVGVFKWLPPELSAINHLPTNSDPRKFRQRFDGRLSRVLSRQQHLGARAAQSRWARVSRERWHDRGDGRQNERGAETARRPSDERHRQVEPRPRLRSRWMRHRADGAWGERDLGATGRQSVSL